MLALEYRLHNNCVTACPGPRPRHLGATASNHYGASVHALQHEAGEPSDISKQQYTNPTAAWESGANCNRPGLARRATL